MDKKIILQIITTIIVLLLLLTVVFSAIAFFGNPISASIAKSKAQTHINDNYNNPDLKITNVVYNAKDGNYLIFVNSNTSEDTHFLLRYRDKEIYSDDYEFSVLSGMNTMDRFCDEYKESLLPLLQAEINGIKSISIQPEKLRNYNLELDSTFNKSLVKNGDLMITYIGGTDVKLLSNVLMTTYDVMNKNGYTAGNFAISSQHETVIVNFINIKPEHIESDNLEELLQLALTRMEYDGIIGFTKGPL